MTNFGRVKLKRNVLWIKFLVTLEGIQSRDGSLRDTRRKAS